MAMQRASGTSTVLAVEPLISIPQDDSSAVFRDPYRFAIRALAAALVSLGEVVDLDLYDLHHVHGCTQTRLVATEVVRLVFGDETLRRVEGHLWHHGSDKKRARR